MSTAVARRPRAAEKSAEAGKREVPKLQLRCYKGANIIITIYFPDGEKERIYYIDQKWLEPIFDYCTTYGVEEYKLRWGYSSLLRAKVRFPTRVWRAEIDADKLLSLITSVPSWYRSDHAVNIVEKLKELLRRE